MERKDKNIIPTNDKGHAHGYCELFWDNGKLRYKGNFINGKPIGYSESYNINGNLILQVFFA